MRFWCSQLFEAWSWTPRPYLGVWAMMAVLAVVRHRALAGRRAITGSIDLTTRQRWWFWLGLASFWVISDWPLGPLGAGYLASVHMAQYLVYTLVTAPLLLLATPEWWLRPLLARVRLYRFSCWITGFLPAVVFANFIFIATHAPFTVDKLRISEFGSFALDFIWILSGFALWMPVIGPLREHIIASPPVRCVYLFGAAGLMPMIPGGFLTFADAPLYRTYELAPRIGVGALNDQQIAGAAMAIGAVPVIWAVMGVIFYKWATLERRADLPHLI